MIRVCATATTFLFSVASGKRKLFLSLVDETCSFRLVLLTFRQHKHTLGGSSLQAQDVERMIAAAMECRFPKAEVTNKTCSKCGQVLARAMFAPTQWVSSNPGLRRQAGAEPEDTLQNVRHLPPGKAPGRLQQDAVGEATEARQPVQGVLHSCPLQTPRRLPRGVL